MSNQAWECPRCKRMNAPFNPTCFCAPQGDLNELEKVMRGSIVRHQFTQGNGWVATCEDCREMLNGLTKHVCKVSM